MAQEVNIHKRTEQSPGTLWWKPLLDWQRQMNDVAHHFSPSFVPSAFWSAERDMFSSFQQNMNRVFGEMFNSRQMLAPRWMENRMEPYVDIIENGKGFVVKADVPGVDANSLDVAVSEGALVIQGKREGYRDEKDGEYMHRECSRDFFSRTVALPEGADTNNAVARLERNVLRIDIPKKEESSQKSLTLEIASGEKKESEAA